MFFTVKSEKVKHVLNLYHPLCYRDILFYVDEGFIVTYLTINTPLRDKENRLRLDVTRKNNYQTDKRHQRH